MDLWKINRQLHLFDENCHDLFSAVVLAYICTWSQPTMSADLELAEQAWMGGIRTSVCWRLLRLAQSALRRAAQKTRSRSQVSCLLWPGANLIRVKKMSRWDEVFFGEKFDFTIITRSRSAIAITGKGKRMPHHSFVHFSCMKCDSVWRLLC